ncbi:cytochrome P450 [Exophiala viscosa]|uniref:Cytochrome P450 n=1 Tax=Exophiala viscosa TaxID=2486360 RepID=A0AAN6DS05_9EURO|nr:cytochrome P450 [Exophiala viscosa]
MTLATLILGALVLSTIAWTAFQYLTRKERLPDVEFIRLSDKPGKAGDADDVQAFLNDSLGAIMKGYNEYSKKGKHFLLRTPRQVYFIAASNLLDEIRRMPDSQLSQPAAANIIFQVKHNFHPELEADMYHFNVIRGKMTQALGQYLPRMVQESGHAFEVEVGNSAEWREMQMWPLTSKVVTRMANAMLVGEPLCRDDEYLQFSCDITPLVFDTAAKIRNYPEFMKSIMMYFMEDRKRQLQIARKHLIPLIKQRLAQASLPAVQSKAERPDDTLQWLVDMTPPEKRDPEILMQRLLHINVNAIHAPAYTLTEAMFDLCRHPKIHEELREEIAEVLAGGNWNKESLDRLVKLDSFIRESSRLTPISAVKMERLAVQDVRLSDGTLIPKGTSIGVIAHGRHLDPDIVPNGATFDAFRYARLRTGVEKTDAEYAFAQATPENMLFGLGRHACPGRLFASALCKIFLVSVLVLYDVKFLEGRRLPQGRWTQKFRNADVTATVGWRLRPIEKRFAGIIV